MPLDERDKMCHGDEEQKKILPKMEGEFLNILEFAIVIRNEKVSQFQAHFCFVLQ